MYNDYEDDDIVQKYLNEDKTKTDALFDKINHSSSAAKHAAPKASKHGSHSAKTAPIPKVAPVKSAPAQVTVKRQSFEELKAAEAAKKQKKKKSKNIWLKVLLALGCFILVLSIGAFFIFRYYFGGLDIESINEESLHIDSELESKIKENPSMRKITNIALFGVDARPGETNSRSDAIMVASINPKKGTIKLISIMRDSYVTIDGDWDKINHAYFYGGPELAIATINENFHLNITDYVTVNFNSLADAVDAIGGVVVNIEEDEIYYVNKNLNDTVPGHEYFDKTGDVLVNGVEAVAYARIRYLDGDQMRTGRQREVVMAMVDALKSKNISELPGIAKEVIPMVETSMTYNEIMAFLPMMKNDITMQQTMIPGDYDGAYDATIDGAYYMAYDIESAAQHIFDFIYNDIDPNTPPEETTEE